MTVSTEVDQVDEAGSRASGGSAIWSRCDPRLQAALTVVLLGLPVVLYVWTIAAYGVNAFIGDDWSNVDLIRRTYDHGLSWNVLWANHNENRMLFPNLIVLALAHLTKLNVIVQLWLSALLLWGAVFLIIAGHRRRCPTPLVAYAPVVFLAFSLAQVQNMLWGFQLAWYLVLLCLAAAYVIVDRPSVGWWWLAAALVIGIFGSFSSLQGLIVWPVGLLLLLQRSAAWQKLAVWVGVGVGTSIFYVHGFNPFGINPVTDFIGRFPYDALRFYLFLMGDIVGIPVLQVGGHLAIAPRVEAFGACLIAVALVVVVLLGLRRDRSTAAPLGVAFALTGLVFGVLTTDGRGLYGYVGAAQSRYTTYDVLVPIGCYLALLGAIRSRPAGTSRPIPEDPGGAGLATLDTGVDAGQSAATPGPRRGWLRRAWKRGLPPRRVLLPVLGAAVVLIAIQISVAIPEGLTAAHRHEVYAARAAVVARSVTRQSNGAVAYYLYPIGPTAWVRQQAAFAQREHLGPYGG